METVIYLKDGENSSVKLEPVVNASNVLINDASGNSSNVATEIAALRNGSSPVDTTKRTGMAKDTLFALVDPTSIKFFTSVFFTSEASPTSQTYHEFCVEVYKATGSGPYGYIRATYEQKQFICHVENNVFSDWQQVLEVSPSGNMYLPNSISFESYTSEGDGATTKIVPNDSTKDIRRIVMQTGQTDWYSGASMELYGAQSGSCNGERKGMFAIRTGGTSYDKSISLEGTNDGALTWNGKKVIAATISSSSPSGGNDGDIWLKYS